MIGVHVDEDARGGDGPALAHEAVLDDRPDGEQPTVRQDVEPGRPQDVLDARRAQRRGRSGDRSGRRQADQDEQRDRHRPPPGTTLPTASGWRPLPSPSARRSHGLSIRTSARMSRGGSSGGVELPGTLIEPGHTYSAGVVQMNCVEAERVRPPDPDETREV